MLLIDDDKKEIIEKIDKSALEPIYNFSLMENSGRIKGYKITDTDEILEKLEKLGDKKAFEEKYSVSGKGVLQYAVGDGNHSLATAKTCYENEKAKIGDEAKNLPLRYALVEVVNLHDESLVFEPIHRVVFGVDEEKFVNALAEKYQIEKADNGDFEIVSNGTKTAYVIKNPDFKLYRRIFERKRRKRGLYSRRVCCGKACRRKRKCRHTFKRYAKERFV